MALSILLMVAAVFVAYSNGANDNFKGVATLFGGKTASYRGALAWAAITTLAGAVASVFLAEGLVARFSGAGLVPDGLVTSPAFLPAVALGAGSAVFLATWLGLPVSTTHGLTGALVGTGLAAAASQTNFSVLGSLFFLPLLLSPVAAIVLCAIVYGMLRAGSRFLGVRKENCVCIGEVFVPVARLQDPAAMALVIPEERRLELMAASTGECVERYQGRLVGISAQSALDGLHYLSAGFVGFARGLNDTPKIAALLVGARLFGATSSTIAVGLGMLIGGVLSARRVAETMSHKITKMSAGQGFAANLATGILVSFASFQGLPVSTTHVSVGSLFGIGLVNRSADPKVVRRIVLSWVFTLPCAALLSAGAYVLLR
ncbi:MAG: inorganic phosphate transporter [Planctomycetes bacterium]|nr:inorganic phosphate transporter [Planctomycetota bacterium]